MKKINVAELVKPSVRTLTAYEAKEVPCKVKLDANESPLGFAAALGAVRGIETNRYPDPEAKSLLKLLARHFGVGPEMLLQGNGSDELIACLITAFGGPVLFPVPTFSMYGVIAQALDEKTLAIPLDEDFDIDLDRTLRVVRREQPKLIFLSSPNNPTGNCFSAERILGILEASRGLVVVDEAYQPFASKRGFAPLLKDYRNLVIMRTLSKVGLAALRLGCIAADPEIIAAANKVRLPFNVNALSQAVAAEVLRKRGALTAGVNAVVAERKRLSTALAHIPGVSPFPSEANFILFRTADADRLHAGLLKRGVLVRNLNNSITGCLRVTVGSPRENTVFLKALKEALIEKSK